MDRIQYHWDQIQQNKDAFDDFTQLSYEEFVDFVFNPRTAAFELGDGIGLCCLVFSGVNAWIQMVVYDYNYRVYLCSDLCGLAFELGAVRVTSTVTENRPQARELVRDRMHCQYEGTLRRAFSRRGEFFDVEVYGILKEDFERWQQQRL